MTHDEAVECLDEITAMANNMMNLANVSHPGIVIAACAMAGGSMGTVCTLSKEAFLDHFHAMAEQAFDRQLEAQAAMAKDHGPLQ